LQISSSLANLGALLTFDLNKHEDAELVLLRSTDIIVAHLGPAASGMCCLNSRNEPHLIIVLGLQFNYRSLIHVYQCLRQRAKVSQYHGLLDRWAELQIQKVDEQAAAPSEIYATFAKTFADLANMKL
jgi:hypothetical protein